MMHAIQKIDRFLARIEFALVVLLLSAMICFAFGQVILRNFFHQGILWTDILLRQLVLWVGFLGASLAVRDNRHISISFIPKFLPQSLKRANQNFVSLIAGGISGWLAHSAWNFVQFEREGQATLFLDLPVWWFQTILPLSFAIIAFRYLMQPFLKQPD